MMYVDLVFLFLMYAFSSIALAVSVYALWTLKEVEELYKKKNVVQVRKKEKEPITVPRAKGLWD